MRGSRFRSVEELNSAERLVKIRQDLECKVQQEAANPVYGYRRLARNPRPTAAQLLETLEVYIELQSTSKAAEQLGVKTEIVQDRIRRQLGLNLRPRGRKSARFEDVNNPAVVRTVLERLRVAIAREQESPEA